MPEEHRDYKQEIKELMLELEEKLNTLDLRVSEVIEEAKHNGINELHAKQAIQDLIEDNYIHVHEARGGEDVISRVHFYRDYSPAYEEMPEY